MYSIVFICRRSKINYFNFNTQTMDGTALTAAAMPTSPPKNGAAALAHSTATAGFTTLFLTITCCATAPKTPTQWKHGTQNVALDQTMLNLESTGAT